MAQTERNRVYLIRHGQVNGYEDFPVYGDTDVDLTQTGLLQMQQLAERLRLVDLKAIYCSDLKRSIIGARLIACHHDVPVYSLPELRESHFGVWEGLTLAEIRERFPEELKKREADIVHFQAPGGGESIADFSNRVMSCFKQILAEQKNNDIAIVAHGGVNRVILCHALGLDLSRMYNIHQAYGCLNIIDFFPDSKLIRLMNG